LQLSAANDRQSILLELLNFFKNLLFCRYSQTFQDKFSQLPATWCQQEAQMMLTNPCGAFTGQSSIIPYFK